MTRHPQIIYTGNLLTTTTTDTLSEVLRSEGIKQFFLRDITINETDLVHAAKADRIMTKPTNALRLQA